MVPSAPLDPAAELDSVEVPAPVEEVELEADELPRVLELLAPGGRVDGPGVAVVGVAQLQSLGLDADAANVHQVGAGPRVDFPQFVAGKTQYPSDRVGACVEQRFKMAASQPVAFTASTELDKLRSYAGGTQANPIDVQY